MLCMIWIRIDVYKRQAVDGWVYTRPCRMKKEDVLLRVPKIHYFRTRYREMSIPMALSSEIFIDETLKKP